jgi:5'-methylthioadenosine phosphorylase
MRAAFAAFGSSSEKARRSDPLKSRGKARIGVIGGSGLYEMPDLKEVEEVSLDTPFGPPSDRYLLGRLSGCPVAFLSRHGAGHRLSPSEINFRANIYGMKLLGVERVLSVSAVGSMKEQIAPGDLVIPDQFIDRTHRRVSTFFEGGLVAHVALAEPTCPELNPLLAEAAREAGATVHAGGAYLCIEGPQFSTRAESHLYRSWGVSVIGMTNLPEAKLAREAEICYSTLALTTDYDCWLETEEPVTTQAVVATLKRNVERAREVIRRLLPKVPQVARCRCQEALQGALLTAPEAIPKEVKERLRPLIGRYVGAL